MEAVKARLAESKRQTQLMQTILDNTDALLFSLDREANFTAFNNSTRKIIQRDRGIEISIGDNFLDIAGANSGLDRDKIAANIRRLNAGISSNFIDAFGEPGFYRGYLRVNDTPVRDKEGNVTGSVICAQDVTEFVRLQTENEEQARLLNAIIESSTNPIFAIDGDWNYIFFNDAHKEVIRRSRAHELKMGDNYLDIVSANSGIDREMVIDIFRRVTAGEQFQTTHEFGEPGLYRAQYEVNYNILRDKDGKMTGVVVFAHDLSDRLLAEKKIQQNHLKIERQAEKLKKLNAFKDKLFSVVSHDLRSPIDNLIRVTEFVENDLLTIEKVRQMVNHIKGHAELLRSTLDSILGWSLLQMGHVHDPVDISIKAFLQEQLSLHTLPAIKKQINIHLECPADVHLSVDRDQLSLIVRNFMDNAVKFTPTGGTITIGVSEHNDTCTLFVSNSGKGIDEYAIRRILSSNDMQTNLGTANERGMGVGLQLCKEFIKNMGSKLQIESTEGVMTTFSFNVKKS